MKTFTELTEKKLSKLFMEFNDSPQLASYVTDGFGRAISSALKKSLMDEKSDYAELVIGGSNFGELMKFALKVVKKGDSVAFVPEFEMGTAGKDFINTDEIEFDEDNITKMANDLTDNKDAIVAFKHAFEGKLYKDEGWTDISTSDDEKGITFDDEADIAMAACAVVAAIIEILCNNKDSSSDIEYEIPGLCKFKVSPVKDGYNTTATFDKEFKSNCKSDKLSEELANA
jgi:hypothetical protein